ncbi:hypothetical protein ELH42_09535 [Rhizobium ruizarguesonis]|uniref:Uncharacterized protein n=1 Tax=Rhizobium ruizarguesonis TaxID=2081791 RepID=A0AB38I4X7_9HYPH|nr:hypothetical protein ELH61_09805 [Rhizobium ruizarguesonis]TBA47802.1 hypothetical protein ELH63_09345 [Rhizobium ruizarguesonis]TBA63985.1 hypothetical protein ELH57_09980 [Rhizobium ruizarguesonis]TBB53909.1 hypothetical protein ELH44_09630 [Rhizobium ruizarguesonis]TBB66378.1 hypothetical protein ELH42_09535 [Rhizobium ruizarguesonis]
MDQSPPTVSQTELCLLGSEYSWRNGKEILRLLSSCCKTFRHSRADNSHFNNRETSLHVAEPTCRAVS